MLITSAPGFGSIKSFEVKNFLYGRFNFKIAKSYFFDVAAIVAIEIFPLPFLTAIFFAPKTTWLLVITKFPFPTTKPLPVKLYAKSNSSN